MIDDGYRGFKPLGEQSAPSDTTVRANYVPIEVVRAPSGLVES
jgi:hypothetical protein